MPLEHGDLHDWTLEVARLERELEKAQRHIANLRELRKYDARNLAEARDVARRLARSSRLVLDAGWHAQKSWA